MMGYMKLISIKQLRFITVFLAVLAASCFTATGARSQDGELTLVHATMCEAIENYLPVYPSVIFSISQGEIICFTAFDPVPEQTHVYHKWYKRDRLISRSRLTLNPPKWSSFSSMQLRNADKGPWRVDVVDSDDIILQTLRFSISD